MAFRYSPRQLGLFGRRKSPAPPGKRDFYEPKDLVTDEEVNKGLNSTVTPYRHKPNRFDALPDGEEFRTADGAIEEFSRRKEEQDFLLRDMTAEVIIDADAGAPSSYTHETEKKGLFGRMMDKILPHAEEQSERPDNLSLGTDADGNIIFEEDIIAMLKDELDRRRQERLPLELQWQLNSNFYDGNQFCDINIGMQEIMQRPECESEEGNSHEVFNRIAPLIETRIANLKKINYVMEVKPATNEADDYQKAKIATAVLRHTQEASGFNTKKDALILWNELCGSCFWLTWWDPTKGNPHISFTERYTDGNGATAYRERTIFEGDVDYGLLTPYEVYPESVFKQTVQDQRSIIVEQVRTVDEIETLYGVRVEGEDVDSFTLTPVAAAGGLGYEATVITMGKATHHNSKRVITYFERRSRAFPRGRMAILIGDDKLVYYGPMPTDDIPIVRTVCKERAGQFFGKSVIEELIPLQRQYNTACNDIADYLKGAKSYQYIVFQGQVDMDEFEVRAGDPKGILVYKGNPAYPPIRQSALAFSGDVFSQKRDLEGQMEYVAAVSQLMVYGQTPTGVTSGTAIESLRDIDNTRLALTGDYIRNSVIELAKLWLGLYKKYASTYRVIQYTGSNVLGAALVWNADDINGYDIVFSTENELMTSETTQWQRVLQLLQANIVDQRLAEEVSEKAREYIKTGKYDTEQSINELQTQAAARENAMFQRGVLPTVNDYDNHKIHADEHIKFILQTDFMMMQIEKPELAWYMIDHWKQHMSILEQNQAAMQMQAADS